MGFTRISQGVFERRLGAGDSVWSAQKPLVLSGALARDHLL